MYCCTNCGSNETYVKNYEHHYTVKGKDVSFISEGRFCKKCDSVVPDEVLDEESLHIAFYLYSSSYGITPEEIVSLRKKFGLSQELFAKVIGCAKKTLVSYETGKSIPNDSYLILLKNLMKYPETIHMIVDSNQGLFTPKELSKLDYTVDKMFSKIDTNELTEFNGYTELSKEKIIHMILYFASEGVYKTKLLKEMFYADFLHYKNTTQSITGLVYEKLTYGPVPVDFETILSECLNEGFIQSITYYQHQYECNEIDAIEKFDSSLFSADELEVLSLIKRKFASFGSKEIADYSHQEKAFQDNAYGEKISYDYAFDIKNL